MAATDTRTRRVCQEGTSQRCDRGGQLGKPAEQIVHSPQKGFPRLAGYHRPVKTEQIDPLRQVQNATGRTAATNAPREF